MQVNVTLVANHNELIARFQQMKPTVLDGFYKCLPPDFMFDPCHIVPHDAAILRCFCSENKVEPAIG